MKTKQKTANYETFAALNRIVETGNLSIFADA